MERTEGREVRHEYHDQIRHDCGSASRRVRVVLRGVVRPYCGDEPGLDSCRLRAGRPVRVAFWRQYGSNNFGFCPVFLTIWLIGAYFFDPYVPVVGAAFLSSLVIAVGEWFFHRYMNQQVLRDPQRAES